MERKLGERNDHAVVLCCDAGHLPFAAFVANKIDCLEPDRRFDIVICVPEGTLIPDHLFSKTTKLVHLNVDHFSQLSLQRGWISNATFYRLLLPHTFRGQYEKLLYLDTDMYPRRPCIQQLFDETPSDVPLSGCLEPSQYLLRRQDRAHGVTKDRIRLLGSRDGRYFNAGLLLIAPDAFILSDGVERFWHAYEDNLTVISQFGEQDQGALNKAFSDEMREISPIYNWHTGALLNKTMVDEFNPAILHFAGRYKPWNVNEDPYISAFTKEYLTFFKKKRFPFTIAPALDSYIYRLQNPKYRLGAVNWVSSQLYLRRRKRHQRRNEFDDLAFKREAIRKLISRADYEGGV